MKNLLLINGLVVVLTLISPPTGATSGWQPEVIVDASLQEGTQEILLLIHDEVGIVDARARYLLPDEIHSHRHADQTVEMFSLTAAEHASLFYVPISSAFATIFEIDYIDVSGSLQTANYSTYFLCQTDVCKPVTHTEFLLGTGQAWLSSDDEGRQLLERPLLSVDTRSNKPERGQP